MVDHLHVYVSRIWRKKNITNLIIDFGILWYCLSLCSRTATKSSSDIGLTKGEKACDIIFSLLTLHVYRVSIYSIDVKIVKRGYVLKTSEIQIKFKFEITNTYLGSLNMRKIVFCYIGFQAVTQALYNITLIFNIKTSFHVTS